MVGYYNFNIADGTDTPSTSTLYDLSGNNRDMTGVSIAAINTAFTPSNVVAKPNPNKVRHVCSQVREFVKHSLAPHSSNEPTFFAQSDQPQRHLQMCLQNLAELVSRQLMLTKDTLLPKVLPM